MKLNIAKIVKILKIIANFGYFLFIIFVIAIIAGTSLSTFEAPGGFRMFSVLSGSMEPAVMTDCIVL